MRRTTPDLVGTRKTAFRAVSVGLLALTIAYVLWTNYIVFVGGNLPLTSISLGSGSTGAGLTMLFIGDLMVVVAAWFLIDGVVLSLVNMLLQVGNKPAPAPAEPVPAAQPIPAQWQQPQQQWQQQHGQQGQQQQWQPQQGQQWEPQQQGQQQWQQAPGQWQQPAPREQPPSWPQPQQPYEQSQQEWQQPQQWQAPPWEQGQPPNPYQAASG